MSSPKVIMIVDDDADDIDFFCDALAEIDNSLECISARGGEEALNLLENSLDNLPDFIFLDLNMPGMNGKHCLKCIKSNQNFDNIKVVIYTTSKFKDDINETKQLGAVYFLTKPNKFSDLKKEIKFILTENWKS